ncbi:MAG: hypothetical protein FJY11_02790 [Bacteroidetes bacterium]|nr:hypothetical protein [Bacteroidota bacterium]
MVRLTIARYFTPTGRSIQSPYADGYDKYMESFLSRYANGEMVTADSIHFPDSLRTTTLTTKRVVYGGGGIMPDLFIAADTSAYSDYYRDVIRNGVVTQFTLAYADNNRERLLKLYPVFDDFSRRFEFSSSDIEDFISRAAALGVEYREEHFRISKHELLKIMKGLVARDLWDMNEYYRIVNHDDPVLIRALEVISSQAAYNSLLGF